jgi:hypothetical protein
VTLRPGGDDLARTWPATMRAGTLFVLILLPFLVLVGGTFLYGWMQTFGGLQQELAIVYFIGLIVLALLLGLKITAVLFSHVGIADGNAAMGLPSGSIRAIIALGLVLIFAVMAMGLFSQLHQSGRLVTSEGLTQAQVEEIPRAQIVAQRIREVDGETLFDVDQRAPGNDVADDVAKQLVTILGTLVVAVSAFYFGANSVQAANTAVNIRRGGRSAADGIIKIDSPKPTSPLTPEGTGFAAYPVVVTTEPPGLAVTSHVIGDDAGRVTETEPGTGKFAYAPKEPGNEVLLRFSLAANPSKSDELVIPNPRKTRESREPKAGRGARDTKSTRKSDTVERPPDTDRPEAAAGDEKAAKDRRALRRAERRANRDAASAPVPPAAAPEAVEPAPVDAEEPAAQPEPPQFTPTPESRAPATAESLEDEEDNLPRPG